MTSFEDAARRMLGAPDDAPIYSNWDQTGSDGCDTCDYGRTDSMIEIYAYTPHPSGKGMEVRFHRKFTDLPALWEALFPDDETDTP